ncbi:hypothetical protein LI99_13930 [Mycolicibacterium smegmatis]|nr:hypothetical protein LJ00_13925 [Mycolicibacterium smegmatis MC2 155]AIU14592.1 hypothetical protein LI99_13930 [Mycolicibacterium smegmatis]AIU21215.1 hypothetical protein LI98_13935 [Mycolicibacterium smegmatis]
MPLGGDKRWPGMAIPGTVAAPRIFAVPSTSVGVRDGQ